MAAGTLSEAMVFCAEKGVEVDHLLSLQGFELVQACDLAVERLLESEETKAAFLTHARMVDRLFKAILPDPAANEFGARRAVFVFLASKIASLNPPVDVSDILGRVERLLDDSVAANAYVILSQRRARVASSTSTRLTGRPWQRPSRRARSALK